MSIGGLQFNDANKIAQSAVESQGANVAQDKPDLDLNAEDFKHAMGFKPEGQDSSGPGIVVVDSNHNEPTLYLDSDDQALGSPFSNFPSNSGIGSGPSTEGMSDIHKSIAEVTEQAKQIAKDKIATQQMIQDGMNLNPTAVVADSLKMAIDEGNMPADQKQMWGDAIDDIAKDVDFAQNIDNIFDDAGDALEEGGIAIAGVAQDVWDGIKDFF